MVLSLEQSSSTPSGASSDPSFCSAFGYNREAAMRWACDHTPCEGVHLGRLQYDLATCVLWSGRWRRDYLFYIANNHPLLGLFFCHPCHPLSKWERLVMLLFGFCTTLLAIFFRINSRSESATWEELLSLQLSELLVISVPVMILELVLFQIAICEMYFKQERCRWLCHLVHCCFKICERCTFLCVFVSSILMLYACGAFIAVTDDISGHEGEYAELVMIAFVKSRLQAWSLWFPLSLLIPCWPCASFPFLWRAELAAVHDLVQRSERVQLQFPGS